MTSHEIERRLRLPAPDEPAVLPRLLLPSRPTIAAVSVAGRIGPGRAVRPVGVLSPRLVLAILALLAAMVAAIATGALRLDLLTGPLDATGEYTGRGIRLAYPADWNRLTPEDPMNTNGASVALILTNSDEIHCEDAEVPPPNQPYPEGEPTPEIDPTIGYEDRLLACLVTKPMQPGEARVVVSQGIAQTVGVGPIDPVDAEDFLGEGSDWFGPLSIPDDADGWTDRIDGMPAKVVTGTSAAIDGAEDTRTWAVFAPRTLGTPWFVRASLRGPDLDLLRDQVDAIARSIRFDERPAPLDETARDEALAKAIDAVDREQRGFQGTDLFGCFSRVPGERAVTVDHGPDGPLVEPARVTCRTTVEPTPALLWHAMLMVSWSPQHGVDAGEWGTELFFDSSGTITGQNMLPGNMSTVFPGTVGELPPPLDEPLAIPLGSIVAMLPPGVGPDTASTNQMYANPHPTIGDRLVHQAAAGTRFAVIDGPVTHQGTDWYLVEWTHGTFYPSELAWLPATLANRPLLAVVDPRCPGAGAEPTVAELVRLIPAERVACFGDRDLELDPVIATREPGPVGGSVAGTPDWLAPDTRWRLFGESGPEGVEGSLPIAIAPSVGDAIPTGEWLTVRGHFADRAAESCERRFPEDWGAPPEPAAAQALRCRELFVVTSADGRDAP